MELCDDEELSHWFFEFIKLFSCTPSLYRSVLYTQNAVKSAGRSIS